MNPNVTQQQADQFANEYRRITAPATGTVTNNIGGAITSNGTLTQNGTDAISTGTYRSPDFAVTPTKTVPSSALTYSGGTNELENTRRRMFDQALATQEQFANQLTPSETETNLQGQLVQAKKLSRDAQRVLDMEQERLATSGNLSGEQAQAFSSDTARRMARTLSDYGNAQQGIADALQAEVARRTATGDMLSKNYQMQKENIALLGDMAKASIPNVIGSPFTNSLTGDVFVYTQDPTTGEIKQTQMGNVGASKEAKVGGWGSRFEELPTSVQTKLMGYAKDFGDRKEVSRFIQTVEAKEFIGSIDPNSQNPADHQQVLYMFAKALDPDSAVREGEYATIESKAQSLFNKYKKQIENAINGTGTLSAEAIKAIQTTLENKYKTNLPMYQKARANAVNMIDKTSGQTGLGERLVGDYDYSIQDKITGADSSSDPLGINAGASNDSTNDPLGIN